MLPQTQNPGDQLPLPPTTPPPTRPPQIDIFERDHLANNIRDWIASGKGVNVWTARYLPTRFTRGDIDPTAIADDPIWDQMTREFVDNLDRFTFWRCVATASAREFSDSSRGRESGRQLADQMTKLVKDSRTRFTVERIQRRVIFPWYVEKCDIIQAIHVICRWKIADD